MIKRVYRRNQGVTLVETAVSIGIMALMFVALAYLVIMTGRNSVLVSEQALSQNQAASAAERITNTVRNAALIKPIGADNKATTLSQILFETPDPTKASGFRTGAILFKEATPGKSDGVIKIFENYTAGTTKTAKGDQEFKGIQNFGINYRTSTWMTIRIFYSYRSYMNFASHDNDNNKKLAGEFITDVIAKNHHPGESGHYAETTTSLFLL